MSEMFVHPVVDGIVNAYLDAVDAEAPGLIEGLYLTGSAALGEFRPHTSDIDFVAVTRERTDQADIAALARAHTRLRKQLPRPFFDGLYVTWDELANPPALAGRCSYSYEGRFRRSSKVGEPVTWHTVARYGIACRGPKPEDVDIWTDAAELAAWTLGNFDSYWRELLGRTTHFYDPWSLTSFTSYGAVWIVLGVSRLHYTLATGDLCSKAEAGRYAIETFPKPWHRVLNEGLRIRQADKARPDIASALTELGTDLRVFRPTDGASLYRTPLARRRDVLAFAHMVIADAHHRFGSRSV
jgi:hypothetical protein